ncbi:MAG: type VI secretion system contractile sheath small subunit [Desulfosalsimonas sp.]
MARETSVAPKERVNIVYKSSTGDAEQDVELPLKQLVLGEFTDKFSDLRLEDRKATSINKDNFNDVLSAYEVSAEMTVENKLADDPDAEMKISLDFKTMRDFEPEAIANKVPELKKLIELRNALLALKGPLSNIPEFRKKIQQLIEDDSQRKQLFAELGLEEEKN